MKDIIRRGSDEEKPEPSDNSPELADLINRVMQGDLDALNELLGFEKSSGWVDDMPGKLTEARSKE